MNTLTVPADTKHLQQVTEFVDSALEQMACPMDLQFRVELAVEETFVNIASYAYPNACGEVEIACDVNNARVILRFSDRGQPYNPLEKPDADTSRDATLNREGGLGILLVKKTMDRVIYSYENGKNILTMEKDLKQ